MDRRLATTQVRVELFRGSRSELRPLFAQADDSSAAIDSYIDFGEVLVARRGRRIAGHVQVIAAGAEWEIKSLAVTDGLRGRGIGAALVQAALDRAFSGGASTVLVATASADIDNLRFYQRLGFRMDRVERDAFRADLGYPRVEVDGIPVRDRVWFSIRSYEFTYPAATTKRISRPKRRSLPTVGLPPGDSVFPAA
jgi:GNAT superfamily N-acetyltransferase